MCQDDDVSGGSGGKAGIPSIPTAAWEEEDLTAPVVVAVSSPGQMSDMELTGPLGPSGADSITADVPSLGALLEDEPVLPVADLDAGITADVPRLSSLIEEEEGLGRDGGNGEDEAADGTPQLRGSADGLQADITAQMDLTLVHGTLFFTEWWVLCLFWGLAVWFLAGVEPLGPFFPRPAAPSEGPIWRGGHLARTRRPCWSGSLQLPAAPGTPPFASMHMRIHACRLHQHHGCAAGARRPGGRGARPEPPGRLGSRAVAGPEHECVGGGRHGRVAGGAPV